ncbi:hypothetical protein SAMN05216499_104116 [Actinacidiphila paucisporea]|uniref:Uncharacterized protein n=1 Tax=Actinacidiphila paucisporea TaxID=310782 RepID=A0A1M7AK15_9ACTN|nr:hypothetical protein SAMN05216499_104116 [Actinacidiphila paucisporea]
MSDGEDRQHARREPAGRDAGPKRRSVPGAGRGLAALPTALGGVLGTAAARTRGTTGGPRPADPGAYTATDPRSPAAAAVCRSQDSRLTAAAKSAGHRAAAGTMRRADHGRPRSHSSEAVSSR